MVDIKLFNGDSFNLLNDIVDSSIDLVITDPPYLHVKGGMKSKVFNTGRTWTANSYMNSEMSDFGKEKICTMLDLLKSKMDKFNGYFFCSKLQLQFYFEWISKNKMKFDLLVWDKQNRAMKSTKFFASDIEYIVRIYESGVSLNKIVGDDGKAISSYYRKLKSFPQPKGGHETMKPLELVKQLVAVSSNENDLVLDPFMGSGTTGIACKELNRNFIGIEMNEKYFDLAKERIYENPLHKGLFSEDRT